MGTKMHRGSNKRAALIGAAALPAIAGLSAALLSSSVANAVPTFSVINQGVAHDSFGDTAIGWTGFLLQINADPGFTISAIDFGHTTNDPVAGVFGPLLQDWGPPSKANPQGVPTPVSTSQNGGPSGLDSHVVTNGQANAGPVSGGPYEDSNLVNPLAPGVNNDTSDAYGTGTVMHHVIGYDAAHQLASVPLLYVVLKDGTSATFNLTGAETSASSSPSFALTGTIVGGVVPPTNKIISLTTVAAAPTTYGSKLTNGTGLNKATFNPNAPVADSINVTGSAVAGYVPGFANNINSGAGQNLFNVQAAGFNPATDQEIYALNIKVGAADPTPAQDTAIIAAINANNTNVVASNVTGVFASQFPGYDILLTATAAGNSSPASLGVDFSQETAVPGVVVTDVAAVPEPASAAAILLGASGLLLGRRKRNA